MNNQPGNAESAPDGPDQRAVHVDDTMAFELPEENQAQVHIEVPTGTTSESLHHPPITHEPPPTDEASLVPPASAPELVIPSRTNTSPPLTTETPNENESEVELYPILPSIPLGRPKAVPKPVRSQAGRAWRPTAEKLEELLETRVAPVGWRKQNIATSAIGLEDRLRFLGRESGGGGGGELGGAGRRAVPSVSRTDGYIELLVDAFGVGNLNRGGGTKPRVSLGFG